MFSVLTLGKTLHLHELLLLLKKSQVQTIDFSIIISHLPCAIIKELFLLRRLQEHTTDFLFASYSMTLLTFRNLVHEAFRINI